MLRRFNEYGRRAGINVMADIRGKLPDGLREIHTHFGDRAKQRITRKMKRI
jgi:hypothetical protein